MKTSSVWWLHRQAYLLHDIGITRHFMFSKPPLRWNWAWRRAWGIWCVAPPNKSLLLLPDYPSAAMPVSSMSRSSQQPLCWKCMFSETGSQGGLMPGYPRELMNKTQADVTPLEYFVCEELRMPSSNSVVNIHLFFLPVLRLSPVVYSFYFFVLAHLRIFNWSIKYP